MEKSKLSTVLIVDDDPDVLELVNKAVNTKSTEFKILYASTGEEAIQMLNTNNIDAIILDVKLSDITGITLGLKIREVLPNIPMALFTSYDGDDIKARAKRMGAFYWHKPDIMISSNKLVKCMAKLLTGKSCIESENGSSGIQLPKYLSYMFNKSSPSFKLV